MLDLSKGDCVVTAGEYAEYGEYGLDQRRHILHSSGGEVGQCIGFAYVDMSREYIRCHRFYLQNTDDGVCSSCTALTGLFGALPSELHPWVVTIYIV